MLKVWYYQKHLKKHLEVLIMENILGNKFQGRQLNTVELSFLNKQPDPTSCLQLRARDFGMSWHPSLVTAIDETKHPLNFEDNLRGGP